MTYKVLPFKRYSYGVLANDLWSDFNEETVALPVIAKKAYFSTPANELPDNGEPNGSAWSQHLGQITYFTPGLPITPAWVTTYIKFYDNFVGQQVKVILNNSAGTAPVIMHDWESVSFSNGSFQPVLQDSQLINLAANVGYWVEVWFETTVNKAPGFYGLDGIEGFSAKYWWSINQAPIDEIFEDASSTDLPGTHF